MKYKGKKLEGRNTDILVLIKGGERVVFRAEALQNYTEFDKLCPEPEPPHKLLPGGVKEPNFNDPSYKKRLDEYGMKKTAFTILKSLSVTEDLEWEKVDLKNPDTWGKWQEELSEAQFTETEIGRILQLVLRVNSLDDDMLAQAKNDFLQEALQQEK